jgi:MerR family transcriptional regulator, light-induced transcriptional regulator
LPICIVFAPLYEEFILTIQMPANNDLNLDPDHFPIRTVSTLTGVNAITLRAWERRYGLVKPIRTAGGHRVYTRADIDSINKILALLENGVSIGRVRDSLPTGAALRKREQGKGPWERYRDQMAASVAEFEESRLEAIYNELLSLHPMDFITHEVLMPLLRTLGERWKTSLGAIAEEHFLAVFLRNKLGARFHHRASGATGPKLVIACLPGELHEVGILLFALAAHDRGFRLVMLGADTPLAELGYAARRSQANAIVVSGSAEPKPGVLDADLSALVGAAGVPVFVGGPVSVRRRDAIVAAGAEPLGSDIVVGLRRLEVIRVNAAR